MTDRLESWKEIAAYLNRSERTVRRWEAHEGLPVRRLQHDKRGSVYAYAPELDAWRDSRQQLLSTMPAEGPAPQASARRRVWHWVASIAFPIPCLFTALSRPHLRPVRSRLGEHPRFSALLDRMNLDR